VLKDGDAQQVPAVPPAAPSEVATAGPPGTVPCRTPARERPGGLSPAGPLP